jgi:hypothetical protein
VRVAVEVGGAKDLGEEGVGGALGEEVAVEPLGLDLRDVGELEGGHELHREHTGCGGLPEDLGHLVRVGVRVRVRVRARARVRDRVGLGHGGRCPLTITPPLLPLYLYCYYYCYYYSLRTLT